MSESIPGLWSPETDEEMDLYEDLLTVTSRADRAGVGRERIVGALLNVGTVVVLYDGEVEGSESPEEVAVPCPECGNLVDAVYPSLGGDYLVGHAEETIREACTVPMEGNEHLEDFRA